ncbi:MAG: amidohydrolase family protein [Caulobacteraceae bacterium]|nr:amidohydrolase family protein [Caulobacteraceae bacterium]
MGLRDNWIFSVDDHIVEPVHLWEKWLPSKLKDKGPRYVRDDDGEGWQYAGQRVPYSTLVAAAGKDSDELTPFPITMDEMRPGCYEPDARVADMNRNRVITSTPFPTFCGMFGDRFYTLGDLDVGKECIRAYNDFLLQEWSAAHPGRFCPIMLVPFWDPEASAKEIERCIPLGAKAIAFGQNPTKILREGAAPLPSIHTRTDFWDPIFAAANAADLPFCIHIASTSRPMNTSNDAPVHVAGCISRVVDPMLTTWDWLFSGRFQQFPNLRILLSEGGVSWIPSALNIADYQVWRHGDHLKKFGDYDVTQFGSFDLARKSGAQTRSSIIEWKEGAMPSDVFREHIFGCYFHDENVVDTIDKIGADNVMIEVDFPHGDSTWPNTLSLAEQTLSGYSEEIQKKVMYGNACRVFRMEPPAPPVTVQ